MNNLALDISGNHASANEGSGTTGVAYRMDDELVLTEVRSSDYDTAEAYWDAVIDLAVDRQWDNVVIEGYRLYNHAGQSARTQTNSTLQTSQLLGALRLALWRKKILYHIQYASEVKSRWADSILINKGILQEGNKFGGRRTNDHQRDALRHLMHFETYKL